MKLVASLIALALSISAASAAPGDASFKGRIAYSCDGNHNDPDDWVSSPVALAILSETGLKECLAHSHYNCILPLTDPPAAGGPGLIG
jgi:hypothetical protein